jgi:ribosome-associated protein
VPASERALDLALVAARAASEKKAHEIIALDVSDRLVLTDVFLIASAGNERQVSGIVDAVEEALLARGVKAVRREGLRQARWVLLDFIDVVVHVQHAEDRAYYALERLWSDCPVIELPADARGGEGQVEVTETHDFHDRRRAVGA